MALLLVGLLSKATGAMPVVDDSAFACRPPHDQFPFCDVSLPVATRVDDLISRIQTKDKANLMTARGRGGDGKNMQALPELGVPAYYWGTNCLHSTQGGNKCVVNSRNETVCPTNFPGSPALGATFDREVMRTVGRVVGTEMRAMFALNVSSHFSLDCWGPVINLNRDPRWGRNGEGGIEDAYAMGELAREWTLGFQSPRPSLANGSQSLLQGIITLKHMAANSLENTAPFNRHNFDANATYGVDAFVMADYYLRPFEAAIAGAGARGVMCSYNAVLGIPTCLSPLMRAAREAWGFEGYVTSDSDSVANAWHDHKYVSTGEEAVALALRDGQCDINSGDTYNNFLISALDNKTDNLSQSDVDRALFNALKQRFDLGLFDPPSAYEWPGADNIGSADSEAMSLRASREALVLLRNDGEMLPLRAGAGAVAVVGPHAASRQVMLEPYPFKPECPPTDGIGDEYGCIATPYEAILAMNGANQTKSAPGCDLFNTSTSNFSAAVDLAKAADAVVLMLGIETCGLNPKHNLNPGARSPGRCFQEKPTTDYVFPDQYLELEAHDRTTIALPDVQLAFAKEVLALGKPTVVILMNAGAVAVDALLDAQRGSQFALIEAFYPGKHGARAIAEGIFGKHNAWGRMPYTVYPANFTDEAEMTEHDLRVEPGRTYRYYRNPTFAFGEGLTTTSWKMDSAGDARCLKELKTDSPTEVCQVPVRVANTGPRAGDTVVLAFFAQADVEMRAPVRRGDGKALLPPIRQLFAFTRVHDVEQGGQAQVVFNVTARDLAQYDEKTGDLVSRAGAYKVEIDDGAGQKVTLDAEVHGDDNVLVPFPK